MRNDHRVVLIVLKTQNKVCDFDKLSLFRYIGLVLLRLLLEFKIFGLGPDGC